MFSNRNISSSIKEAVKNKMPRMRLNPKLYDYCYLTTKNNLSLLKKNIINTCDSSGESSVLDIGCGSKPFLSLFDKSDYIGLDISKDSRADIIHSLDEPLPFENKCFDVIIISEALEHVATPLFFIEDSFRDKKKNGLIYISTPFAFLIHGRPYDFYRYTEYFYREVGRKYNADIIDLKASNSILTTPIYTYMQVIMPLSFIPYWLKNMVYFFCNVMMVSIDGVLNRIPIDEKHRKFLNSFPAGYAVIMRKK